MNKAPIFLLLTLLTTASFGNLSSYADASENVSEVKLNQAIKIDEESRIFEIEGEGKNRTEFRIKNTHNNENSEFMVKGVISAFTSDSLTIDSKTIKIDSSVTGGIKIVGKLEVGAYAMAKGIVSDSNFYANKIVVDNRNKHELEEENENEEVEETPTPTTTPTVTVSPTPTSTESAEVETSTNEELKLDLSRLIERLQDILNFLTSFVSTI